MVAPISGGNAYPPLVPSQAAPPATTGGNSSLRGRVGYAAAFLLGPAMIAAAIAMPMPTLTHAYAAPSGPPITAVVGGCTSSSGLYDQDNVRYRVLNDGIGEQAQADVYDERGIPGRDEPGRQPRMVVHGDVLTGSVLFALPQGETGALQNTLEISAVGNRLQVGQRDAGFDVRGDARILTIEGNGVQSTVVLGDHGADRMDVYVNQQDGPPKYQPGESIMEVPTAGNGPAVINVANQWYDGGFYGMTSGCEDQQPQWAPFVCVGQDATTADNVAYRVVNGGTGDIAQADVYAAGEPVGTGQPRLSVQASVPDRTVYFVLPGQGSTPQRERTIKPVGGELRVEERNGGDAFTVGASGDNRTVTIKANGVQTTVALDDQGDRALEVYTNQVEIGNLVPGEALMVVPTDLTGPALTLVATGKAGAADDTLLRSDCA